MDSCYFDFGSSLLPRDNSPLPAQPLDEYAAANRRMADALASLGETWSDYSKEGASVSRGLF